MSVLVEAFAPRKWRRALQLVIVICSVIAALVVVISLAGTRIVTAAKPAAASILAPRAAAPLCLVSPAAEVCWALPSYVTADPDARSWLDGAADPWGMKVNPNYKSISLPVNAWPVLDTFVSDAAAQGNPCLGTNPVPFLPLVAAPVSNPATVTLNMQFQNSNSTVVCKDAGDPNQKLVGIGRQITGRRALFGIVAALAEQGATVAVNDLHTDRAEATAASVRFSIGWRKPARNDSSVPSRPGIAKFMIDHNSPR